MNPPFPSRLQTNIHRLLRTRDGLVALPDLGNLYAQVRTPGGGLGKSVARLQPILVEGLDFAFDPDAGLGYSVRDLEAIHVRTPHAGSFFQGSLTFEFRGFPHGLGLHLLPEEESGDRALGVDALVASVPTEIIDEASLGKWRDERTCEAPMCPCCHERAKSRARCPEAHPLHTILHHALAEDLILHWHLTGEHADLTATFIPARIEARDGFLVASDAPARHAVHVDMARLHALAIRTCRLDGIDYSRIRLIEPRGKVTFEILAEDPSLAPLWRRFCETPAP